jgi:hypothetical protein
LETDRRMLLQGGCETAVPFGLGGRRTDPPGAGRNVCTISVQCVGGWVRRWHHVAADVRHRTQAAQRAAHRGCVVVDVVATCLRWRLRFRFVWKSPLHLKTGRPATTDERTAPGAGARRRAAGPDPRRAARRASRGLPQFPIQFALTRIRQTKFRRSCVTGTIR